MIHFTTIEKVGLSLVCAHLEVGIEKHCASCTKPYYCDLWDTCVQSDAVKSSSCVGQPMIDEAMANVEAIVAGAKAIFGIEVVYRRREDGLYEVEPVGCNEFSAIVPRASLPLAVMSQLTTYMESPVFLQEQMARVRSASFVMGGQSW